MSSVVSAPIIRGMISLFLSPLLKLASYLAMYSAFCTARRGNNSVADSPCMPWHRKQAPATILRARELDLLRQDRRGGDHGAEDGERLHRPVLPNPPAPRLLSANCSTTSNSTCTTGTTTSWAMRSRG